MNDKIIRRRVSAQDILNNPVDNQRSYAFQHTASFPPFFSD